jgi:predicted nuclease of predicted toxin-antitoxin system
MSKYLIDANLPYRLQVFNSIDFVFSRDFGIEKDDLIIWNYAKEHKLTIITRDFDFCQLLLSHGFPPRIIWIRLHGIKTKQLGQILLKHWPEIATLSSEHGLVEVLETKLVGSF